MEKSISTSLSANCKLQIAGCKCHIWWLRLQDALCIDVITPHLHRKNNINLKNSVGVIDSDYYNNIDNEGNICFVLENCGDEDFILEKGSRYAQGVFMKYLVTDNDVSVNARNGGIGSTLM